MIALLLVRPARLYAIGFGCGLMGVPWERVPRWWLRRWWEWWR